MTKTKTKHTPGHWKIELHDDIFIRSKDGVFICNIPFSYSNAAANAALIAVAPELLEALIYLYDKMDEADSAMMSTNREHLYEHKKLKEIGDIIEKATTTI